MIEVIDDIPMLYPAHNVALITTLAGGVILTNLDIPFIKEYGFKQYINKEHNYIITEWENISWGIKSSPIIQIQRLLEIFKKAEEPFQIYHINNYGEVYQTSFKNEELPKANMGYTIRFSGRQDGETTKEVVLK